MNDKLSLSKWNEILENEITNLKFEVKWVWNSKWNIEELLNEHITRCIELEWTKQSQSNDLERAKNDKEWLELQIKKL